MIFQKSFLDAPCVKSEALYKIAKKMFLANRISKRVFFSYINCFEGGQYYSPTLRRIFKEVYDIDVGIGSYGGIFQGGWRPHVKVGNYCSFATGIQRLYANHPLDAVSTHPMFHLKEFGCVAENSNPIYELVIGNDVWIGVNAIITSKCRHIGDGAVVGAGAVVTHDLEPYGIYAGNPARLIRYRFEKATCDKLIQSGWYELYPDQLKELIEEGGTIDEFCSKISKLRKERNL